MSVTSHAPAYRTSGTDLGVRVDDAAVRRRAAATVRRPQLRIVAESPDAGARPRPFGALVTDRDVSFTRSLTEGANALAAAPLLTPAWPLAPESVPELAPVPAPGDEIAPVIEVRHPSAVAPEATRATPARPMPRPRSAASAKYRLTLRGQRVLLAAGVALAIGVGAITGTIINLTIPAAESSVVTVQPGDSLWSIAGTVSEPGADLRPVVAEIAALNDLAGSTIVAGQSLRVPTP